MDRFLPRGTAVGASIRLFPVSDLWIVAMSAR
jgi:hypothetical protein